MSYETLKSFILFILVALSFFLSFLLWSYQPKYEDFYDTSYVSEVDIGGEEKKKNDLISPLKAIFHHDHHFLSYESTSEMKSFFKEITEWTLYDIKETDYSGRPEEEESFVELIFPTNIPARLIPTMFTLHEEIYAPDWSFERMFLTFDEEHHSLIATFVSIDERKEVKATIEKSEAYEYVLSLLESADFVRYIEFGEKERPIYLPLEETNMTRKTLVASTVNPDLFIDALFTNPSLVKSNIREAYFTDGQRGMRVLQDGLRIEYINPLQTKSDILDYEDLFDRSVKHLNEHRGWTDEYLLDDMKGPTNYIRYRLYYDDLPVFNYAELTTIEQKWNEQDLYEYSRPLIYIENLLSTQEVQLISGEELIDLLEQKKDLQLEQIKNIQAGYLLTYLEDGHSLTLDPHWFMLYQGEWIPIQSDLDHVDFSNEEDDR